MFILLKETRVGFFRFSAQNSISKEMWYKHLMPWSKYFFQLDQCQLYHFFNTINYLSFIFMVSFPSLSLLTPSGYLLPLVVCVAVLSAAVVLLFYQWIRIKNPDGERPSKSMSVIIQINKKKRNQLLQFVFHRFDHQEAVSQQGHKQKHGGELTHYLCQRLDH